MARIGMIIQNKTARSRSKTFSVNKVKMDGKLADRKFGGWKPLEV
jgi:hypothetical protein